MSLTVLDYGAVIQKLMVRDKFGKEFNVVVGLEKPTEYLEDEIALGASVGRFAGRISGGGFNLGPERFSIHEENGVHLHGGRKGFAKKYWRFEKFSEDRHPSVRLSYTSQHLEEGYPGQLEASVSYTLIDNGLHIRYEATTDRTTIVNLTNHSYFRLDNSPDIGSHTLQLSCLAILETDTQLLPTGRLIPVNETGMDFSRARPIGTTRMDTPFVCEKDNPVIGEIFSDQTGIRMKISSNQPAVVIYTPPDFPAICFETQNYPDAPNFRNFPSAVLEAGETYVNTAVFEFDLVI